MVLTAATLRKSRTYPELVGPRARARLVGRWAPETRTFLSCWHGRERGVSPRCFSEEQSRRGVFASGARFGQFPVVKRHARRFLCELSLHFRVVVFNPQKKKKVPQSPGGTPVSIQDRHSDSTDNLAGAKRMMGDGANSPSIG